MTKRKPNIKDVPDPSKVNPKLVCNICGKILKTEHGVFMHKQLAHPEVKDQRVDPEYNYYEDSDRYGNPFNKPFLQQDKPMSVNQMLAQQQQMMMLSMMQEQMQQSRINNAILLKSLSKDDTSSIDNLLKLDTLLENRYGGKSDDGLMQTLLPMFMGDKKKPNPTVNTNPVFPPEKNIVQGVNVDMKSNDLNKAPTEEIINQIPDKLKEQIRRGKLDKDETFNMTNLQGFQISRQKFDEIWEEIEKES